MKLKNKKVLVYGLCQSGEWASKLLIKNKAQVFLYDDDLSKLRNRNLKKCYLVQELNESIIAELDFLVVSPSVEKDNEFLLLAEKHNKKIYSELEFAANFTKNYLAVTGTNGKTTTVELISQILNKKYKAVACGNNGYCLSRAVMERKKHIKVIEVSSFMLENSQTFSPHIATILNIESDHLVRHKTMDEYSTLKLSIFKNVKETDYVVVNFDKKFISKKPCRTITYSYAKPADVCVRNGYIYLKDEKLIAINQLKLKGKHNIYNIMCAICFAYVHKVKPELIKEALMEFKPNHFRIERLNKINDICFINDSKSTNIASTLACVDSVKGSIILLLCGSTKELDYNLLFEKLSKRVKEIIVFGEISEDVITANNNQFKIKKCENLDQAFDYAVSIAIKNDNVVLSPSSASYDQFSSYIERGKAFNKKVQEYEIANKKK